MSAADRQRPGVIEKFAFHRRRVAAEYAGTDEKEHRIRRLAARLTPTRRGEFRALAEEVEEQIRELGLLSRKIADNYEYAKEELEEEWWRGTADGEADARRDMLRAKRQLKRVGKITDEIYAVLHEIQDILAGSRGDPSDRTS